MRTNFIILLVSLTLVALALPAIQREMLRRQERDCTNNLKNIGSAMEMYSTDFAGRYPKDDPNRWYTEEASLRQLTPNYLKTLPTCPEGGAYKVSTAV